MTPSLWRGAAVGLPASLIRLHRHSRANLLVTGGTRSRRLEVVHRFHRSSPIADEPLVAMDCARDEPRLARALEAWLLTSSPTLEGDPGLERRIGVLYLDSITALSSTSQRLLLMIAHRLQGLDAGAACSGPRRLMAGDRTHLVHTARSGRLSPALVDHLDKIRVELDLRRTRGVA